MTETGDNSGQISIFANSRLKVRRARKHIDELRQSLDDFSSRVDLVAEHVGRSEHHDHYVLRFTQAPPDEIPVILGDAVHNLRASLDMMICDFARSRGISTDKLKYPMAESAEALEKILAKDIKKLGTKTLDLIRKTRPFKGVGSAIRDLHDLDIEDKHETIIPLYIVAMHRLAIPDDHANMFASAMGFDLRRMGAPLSEGGTIVVAHDIDPRSFFIPAEGGPQAHFPRGKPFEDQSAVEVLEWLAIGVEELLGEFEKLAMDSEANN
jgi:hypothetical protein